MPEGVWRTVNGARVFIKDGQTLGDAMSNAGFNSLKTTGPNGGYGGLAFSQNIPEELRRATIKVVKGLENMGFDVPLTDVDAESGNFEDDMVGCLAYMANGDNSTIYINPHKLEEINNFHSSNFARQMHKNANTESLLAHEIGHTVSVEGDVLSSKAKEAVDNAFAKFKSTGGYEEVATIKAAKYGDKVTPQDIKMESYMQEMSMASMISPYATNSAASNPKELFAEALADVYRNESKANTWSTEIINNYLKGGK